MRARVTVRVPGSTSNLGAGFDCVGVAVDRWLAVAVTVTEGGSATPTLERRGTLSALDVSPDRDLVIRGVAAACGKAGRRVPSGLSLIVESDIPIARGLGSSAAATVAGAGAATALLELDLDREDLTALCAELEGHPDNVAPAVYGGAKLVLPAAPPNGPMVASLVVHDSIALVFAVPDFTVETKRARAVLPAALPHGQAVRAAAKAAALVHGLAHADARLLAAALDDVLHVPFRLQLVPGYGDVTAAAVAAGAYGATLSGSGPTVVAVAPRPHAGAVGDAMVRAWSARGTAAESFVTARPAGGLQID